uniref:Putative nucleic acid-binding protein asmtl n=1 Tax=Panstrongylus megistus TaxID=65343 RepID=A0A069DXV5_9HEMI
MLEPIKHALDFQRIILASVSPRRSEILHSIGLHFEIMPSLFEENLDPRSFPSIKEFAVETAYRKVLDVAERMSRDPNQPDIIIGADTVVVLDGRIYGKPGTMKNAQKYLETLSGRQHAVHTGVAIRTPNATVKFHETTLVTMAYLSEEVINAYLRTKEPLDKAGGYAIQGIGASLIEKIDGDYYNVMGLPVHSFCKHLLWLYEDRSKKMELTRTIGAKAAEEVMSKKISMTAPKTTERNKSPK